MSQEMKRLIQGMFKYDLIAGFIFSIMVSIFLTLKIGAIFFLGVLIALINFLASGIILEHCIFKNKKILLICSYFIRIGITLMIALLFINKLNTLLAYILGYISHFVLLIIYSLIHNERM